MLIFLEGFLTLSNVYGQVNAFEIIKLRKLWGNLEAKFGLKWFFSYIHFLDNFLAEIKL